MEYVIDFCAFFDKEYKFRPKEVAIVSVQGDAFVHWMVKPPHEFSLLSDYLQRTNNVLTRYVHEIEWFEGDITENELEKYLTTIVKSAKKIYVHGDAKAQYLINIIGRKIVNLDEYNAPLLSELESTFSNSVFTTCIHHLVNSENWQNCALHKAALIKNWLKILKTDLKKLRQSVPGVKNLGPYFIESKENETESQTLEGLELHAMKQNEVDDKSESDTLSVATSSVGSLNDKENSKQEGKDEDEDEGEEKKKKINTSISSDMKNEHLSNIRSDTSIPSSEYRRISSGSNTDDNDEADGVSG